MEAKRQVHDLLRRYGGTLLRSKKHNIWKFPDGKKFTTPSTPSDVRGWSNTLSDLRHKLGILAGTLKDHDHVKKEAYVKPIETPQQLLASLPEREERRPTPVTPANRHEREKIGQEIEEDRTRVHSFLGRIPGNGRGKGKGPRMMPSRHSAVYTFSPEVMGHAQFLLTSQGNQAMNKYLNDVRLGKGETTMSTEAQRPNDREVMEQHTPQHVHQGGLIEGALENAKQKAKYYRTQVELMMAEADRAEKVVSALEAALIAAAGPAEPKRYRSSSESGGRKLWRPIILECLKTSPTPLTRRALEMELREEHKDASVGSIYQVLHKGIKDGWLKEIEGIIHAAE